MLCPPESGELRTLLFDPVRNYFFAAAYETGEVFIFEIGKQGHEKVSKQIGYLRNKEHIVDMLWQSQKMELLLSTLDGEIFFWDTVKAKQICNCI